MEDRQLIEEFVARRSETAFGDIVNRYINLVHSAAVRQVRDAQLAQEVTQAVFIVLARKIAGLPKGTLLAGWLYRTTRFVAARALRAEQRRHHREQRAFEMQQHLSSPDPTWQRLAPMLDEAMDQLGEKDRNAVILRFLQDEPLQRVGTRLGISEEAARKRVDRSLEKLRGFFGRHGFTITASALATVLGSRAVQAAPVGLGNSMTAAALAAPAAGFALASAPALVRETLNAWRWTNLKLAAGVGAALIVAALLLNGVIGNSRARSANAGLRTKSNSGTSAANDSASLANQSATAAKIEAVGSASNDTKIIGFQAMDAATSKGVAGARVLTLIAPDAQHVDVRTNQVTDSEGRCDIPFSQSNPVMVVIGVLVEGYEQRCLFCGGPNGPDQLPQNYVLKLSRGSRIGGVVKDEAGRPIPNAQIIVQFRGVGDASWREFQRERPGFPADDLPVATTDAAGRWSFGSAPATNGNFSIEVKHPDFPRASFGNDGDERFAGSLRLQQLHAGTAILVLHSGPTLRGVVSDERQLPVSGAEVWFGMFYGETNPKTTTTDDGSFVLPNLSAGEGYVTIIAQGFAPERIRVELSSNATPIQVQLHPGAWLRLRTVDEQNHPVPHVRVQLQQWRGNNTLDWGGLTDDAGRLEWNNAPRDRMDFAAIKEGYFYSRNNFIQPDGEEHTITLQPRLIISGMVKDAVSKEPVARFKVIPGSASSSDQASWERHGLVYGTNGQYKLTFDEFHPPFQVRFEADGYETVVSEALDARITQQTLNMELRKQDPTEAFSGTVTLPDGTAAPGAQVGLCTRDHGLILSGTKFFKDEREIVTATDSDGRFAFRSESKAHTLVAVHPQGFACLPITPTNHVLAIQLQRWGRIEGMLKLKNRSNAGQQIVFWRASGPANGALVPDINAYSVKTDDHGDFVFAQVPPGDFDLFHVPGMGIPFALQTPVHVEPGETLSVQIGGSGTTIAGKFKLSDPALAIDWKRQVNYATLSLKLPPLPIPSGLTHEQLQEWQIQFDNSDEGRARTKASRSYPLEIKGDGAFTVDDVPAGTYELSAFLFAAPHDPGDLIPDQHLGSAHLDVVVPETNATSAGTEKSDTLDIGTVTIPILNGQEARN